MHHPLQFGVEQLHGRRMLPLLVVARELAAHDVPEDLFMFFREYHSALQFKSNDRFIVISRGDRETRRVR